MATDPTKIPCGPNQRLMKGSEVFKEQLAKIDRQVNGPEELERHFAPLFDALESMEPDQRPKSGDLKAALLLARDLSKEHTVPAFGYPRTYMRIIAGDLSREGFASLARGGHPPSAGSKA